MMLLIFAKTEMSRLMKEKQQRSFNNSYQGPTPSRNEFMTWTLSGTHGNYGNYAIYSPGYSMSVYILLYQLT